MARRNFIEIDARRVRADIKEVNELIGLIDDEAQEALSLALRQFGEDMLAEAIQKAPIDEGFLRQSGTTSDAIVEADGIVVFVGFNIVYAALRDQGTKGLPGGAIRPTGRTSRVTGKPTRRLFVPLRKDPFIVPGNPGLVQGKDFVLVREVRQQGNRYLSGTFDSRKATAGQLIGQRFFELLADELEQQQ